MSRHSFIYLTCYLQENYNSALSEKVMYKVNLDHLDDPHVKANLLFQVSTLFKIYRSKSNFSFCI